MYNLLVTHLRFNQPMSALSTILKNLSFNFILFSNKLVAKIRAIEETTFIASASILTYFSLWSLNLSNKEIVVLFFLLFAVLILYSRNIGFSLLLTYLISSIIFVGKTHYYQLIDLKEFPHLRELYPFGLGTFFIIKPSDIFSFIMFMYLLFMVFGQKKVLIVDEFGILLSLYFLWILAANIFASPRVLISLFHTIDLFQAVILYFFLKIDKKVVKNLSTIVIVFCVIIVFQSYISIQQLINSAPLGKNIELVHVAPKYGGVIDEVYFTFRPVGTFLHSNNLGVYLSALILILLSFYFIYSYWIYLVSIFFTLVTIILTLSRTAWIGLFTGSLYFFYSVEHILNINLLKKNKVKFLLLVLLLSPLLIYSLPRISRTIFTFAESGGGYLRIKQAQEVFNLVKSSIFFGTGSGMSVLRAIEMNKTGVFTNFPDQIHNHYLLILVENGMVGLILLISIIYVYFIALKSKLKELTDTNKKIFLYGILGSSIIITLSPISQPFFYYTLLILFYHLKDIA